MLVVACIPFLLALINPERPSNAQLQAQFEELPPGTSLADCRKWLDERHIHYLYSPNDEVEGNSGALRLDNQTTYKWRDAGGILTAEIHQTGYAGPFCSPGQYEVNLVFDRRHRLLGNRIHWIGNCV